MSDKEYVPNISGLLGVCTEMIQTLGSELRQSRKELLEQEKKLRAEISQADFRSIVFLIANILQLAAIIGLVRLLVPHLLR